MKFAVFRSFNLNSFVNTELQSIVGHGIISFRGNVQTEIICNADLDRVITVGVAIFQFVIPRMRLSISVVQLTNQTTKPEIDALTALILRACDETLTDIFYIWSRDYVTFKITPRYRICHVLALLRRDEDEERWDQ